MRGQLIAGRATVESFQLAGVGAGWSPEFVRCTGFSKTFSGPVRRRELPSQHVSLIINFGDPLVLVGPGVNRQVDSFATGLQTAASVTERSGRQRGLHVELSPLAAHSLLGVPMYSLTDIAIDLPTVLGRDVVELVERLALAKSWQQRFAMMRTALTQRIAEGPPPTPAVAAAWQRLRTSNGRVRIGELVRESGLSHRHFVSRFRTEVGMTPKGAARVLRFEHSLSMLRQNRMPWAEVAAAAGYCDQAHLNRDFLALAGCPPGALLDLSPAAP